MSVTLKMLTALVLESLVLKLSLHQVLVLKGMSNCTSISFGISFFIVGLSALFTLARRISLRLVVAFPGSVVQ